jgi:hypothetical protein
MEDKFGKVFAKKGRMTRRRRDFGLTFHRMACLRIEDGKQHHFILLPSSNRQSAIANRKSIGGFKRLQRIGHDPGANDDLVCGAHESGWPRMSAEGAKVSPLHSERTFNTL